MGCDSKENITFAKKMDKECLSCEFINLCYQIVLLTQNEPQTECQKTLIMRR